MRTLRNVELACGVLSGILGILGVVVGAIVPVGSGEWSVYRDGVLIQTGHHETSLAQFVGGTERAIGILAAFAVLSLWVMWAAILHARSAAVRWFGMALLGLLLIPASIAAGVLFGPLFLPSAMLALLFVVLAAWRQGVQGVRR